MLLEIISRLQIISIISRGEAEDNDLTFDRTSTSGIRLLYHVTSII